MAAGDRGSKALKDGELVGETNGTESKRKDSEQEIGEGERDSKLTDREQLSMDEWRGDREKKKKDDRAKKKKKKKEG